MDVQLYLDKMVYPTLDLLLEMYKESEVDKDKINKIANIICNMETCSLDWNKSAAKAMKSDALTYFKSELGKFNER